MRKATWIITICILLINNLSSQQLCDGNLGINIFDNGDFGSGVPNVVQTDPNIAPGYTYITDSKSPDDGFYNLTNDMNQWGFNFGTWIRIPDNSDDAQGYMMVVNASFAPGLFYEQQIDGLCENTLYEFSADVINIVKRSAPDHIEPNIDFLIDDLAQFSTGNVPQDETWYKYGFTFTTDPGQTSVKLSLRNNAPGGIGNDLAIDNIRFQACGPDAFVTAEQTIFICQDDNTPISIQAEITASNQAIQWQSSIDSIIWEDIPNANGESIIHDIFDVGRYYYRYISAGTDSELLNEKCRIISDILVVEVLALNYDIETAICFNEVYEFGSQNLNVTGNYSERFISSRGCDSIVDLNLTVLEQEALELDTTFINPTCFGFTDGSIQIDVINGTYGPYTYAIDEAITTNNLFEGLAGGNYIVTITNNIGCTEIFPVNLTQPDAFTLSLPDDTTIDLGESLDVRISTNQEVTSIEWTPDETSPCGACLEFSFTPLSSGTYSATATNDIGCTSTDAFNIEINIEDLNVYIPNIIDPAQNGDNRTLTIGAKPGLIQNVKTFSIYDRWGNIVHQVTNTTDLNLWNGTIDNGVKGHGVFVYKLTLELIDGNEYEFSGDVLLLK